MPHTEPRPHETPRDGAAADTVMPAGPHHVEAEEPPSSALPIVAPPWGTPGNHLTGPIPRIRRRDDGSLTHGARDASGGGRA